jgi:hypothetical protein
MDPDFRGNPAVVECTVKEFRTTVSVRCGSGAVMKGARRGRSITFRTPTITEGRVVAVFTARTNESGTTMSGTWHVTGTAVNESGKFTASKQ